MRVVVGEMNGGGGGDELRKAATVEVRREDVLWW